MPRAKQQQRSSGDVPWGGFIDLRLNEKERTQFEQYMELFDWSDVEAALGDDLKLGLSWDKQGDTFIATFSSTRHAGPNMRCVLTGRADDWKRAVALVCFKHFRLLEADWSRYVPSTGRMSEV